MNVFQCVLSQLRKCFISCFGARYKCALGVSSEYPMFLIVSAVSRLLLSNSIILFDQEDLRIVSSSLSSYSMYVLLVVLVVLCRYCTRNAFIGRPKRHANTTSCQSRSVPSTGFEQNHADASSNRGSKNDFDQTYYAKDLV
jgi:hypothetical protein